MVLVSKSITILLFVVLCMNIAPYVYGCNSDCGHHLFEDAFQKIQNRKVGFGKGLRNGNLYEEESTKNRGNPDWSELRWVPSGPDPLHHNVVAPKRPRTP